MDHFTVNSNILDTSVNSKITADMINNFVKHYHPESVLANSGNDFLTSANSHGMNVIEVVAHAMSESAWGTSYFSRVRNNDFGIGAYDSNPNNAFDYPSHAACIEYYCAFVSKQYLTPGGSHYHGNSLISMQGTYWTSTTQAFTICTIMNMFVDFYNANASNSQPTQQQMPLEPHAIIGNTHDYPALSLIAQNLFHLPNPNTQQAWEYVLQFNPQLRTGSYDLIPNNTPVYGPTSLSSVSQPSTPIQPAQAAPQAAVAPQNAPSVDYQEYTVQNGDQLGYIFEKLYPGVPLWGDQYNSCVNFVKTHSDSSQISAGFPQEIHPGQVLRFPKSV